MSCNTTLVVHIVHKGTGLAVDLEGDNKHLVLKPLDSSESQHWIAQKTEWGSYIFVNRKSGKALDCRTHAKTEPVRHTMSQEWFCNSEGVLRNVHSDVVLSVWRNNVIISNVKNTLNEQFRLHVCGKELSYKRRSTCY